MNSKITYDNEIELLQSNSFIHYNQNEPVTISITEDDNTNINIRLEFNYDKDIEKESFKFSEHDVDTLKITINHKGQLLNYGYINPIKIGVFNNYELFFNLRIDINSTEDSPLVNYTWYKGKKVSI